MYHGELVAHKGRLLIGSCFARQTNRVGSSIRGGDAILSVHLSERMASTTTAVIFALSSPEATLPTRRSAGAAGYDLCIDKAQTIPPNATVQLTTGVFMDLGDTHLYARLCSRGSTIFRYNIQIIDGVIDSDYRGELRIVARNLSPDMPAHLPERSRIAQLVFHKIAIPDPIPTTATTTTERGAGGFGSTG